jgi:OOP family OmpA-OmpF porin
MRLSSLFAIVGVFAAAAFICLVGARFAVIAIEDNSRSAVLNSLDEEGLVWSEVDTDGLQVYLAGTAPSEAARFRALSVAGGVVDAARLIDQMLVEETQNIAIPRFSMEILRNDSGISLIGLVPASMNRQIFLERVEDASADEPISDLLESADYPAPEGWEDATGYALRSLQYLERTKISVSADRVAVRAITGSAEEKSEVEAQLSRRVPENITLTLDIDAPRPIVAPFTLRFAIDADGAHFDACSADTEDAREQILAAAQAAGMTDSPNCIIGLGVPSPSWAQAVSQSITALAELGQGTVTFSDGDISLLAVEGTDQGLFDDVIGTLESDLPDLFALTAVLPEPPDAEAQEELEFTATLSPEGLLQLRGRVATAADKTMVDSFAMARFSTDGVDMKARIDEGLPDNWTFRIVTGLDALSYLTNGIMSMTPDTLTVSGNTGRADANTMIAALLSDKLGEGAVFNIDVLYEEKLDPVASIPTPEECEALINQVKDTRKINFEPGSARLDVAGKQIMDDIAEILRECGELTMEIGGHTDSQGREVMNQQLSQSRAQTILNELRMRRVLTGSITAVGYGESEPIADNDTEEGREANRRIEFKVITPGSETEQSSDEGTDDETALESAAETSQEENSEEAAGDTPSDEDGTEDTAATEAEDETSDE